MSALYLTSSLLEEGILLHAVKSLAEHVLLPALHCYCKELPDILAVVSLLLPAMQGHQKDLNIVNHRFVPMQITAATILMCKLQNIDWQYQLICCNLSASLRPSVWGREGGLRSGASTSAGGVMITCSLLITLRKTCYLVACNNLSRGGTQALTIT